MGMIPQDTPSIQETLASVLRELPIVLIGGESCIYILVRDLQKDTENFIKTGKADTDKLHVLPETQEDALIEEWRLDGFEYGYHCQPIEYMRRRVTIKYLWVKNPKTGMEISLIPWFMLPGKPYPIFVYVYAIWHYINSEQKSMRLSAAATGAVFKIIGFNKSTLCRSIKTMGQIFGRFKIKTPLSTDGQPAPAAAEMSDRISGILKGCPSIKSLEKVLGANVGRLPPPIRRIKKVKYALSRIPDTLSNVFKERADTRKGSRDNRKRPARPHKMKTRYVQRKLRFVESQRLEAIRTEFIALCKAIVLDAAISYHRFLI